MRTEPSAAVERYLRSRGLRYFRGRHDGEYFFILRVGHQQFHVHVEVVEGTQNVVAVKVAPAHFFPATDRDRLDGFAREWNAGSRYAEVVVYESSDPTRIGLAALSSYRLDDADDFAEFADKAIRSAVKLLAEPTPAPELADAS
ncbi:MAG: hypothetical protein ACM4D3_00015 [Candidatus Sericytochromatia bacterium]